MSLSLTDVVNEPGTGHSDPAWLRAVMVFNLSPAVYAHPSWFPPGTSPAAITSRALRREVSAAMLAERGLSAQFQWQPTQSVMQPMLLSVHSGAELALSVGVMAHRSRLRQVVQREVLARWHALLGDRLDWLWSPLAERIPNAPNVSLVPGPQALETLREDGQAVLLGLLNPDELDQALVLSRAQWRLPRARVLDDGAWRPQVPQAQALALSLMDPHSRWSTPWTWLS